VIRPPRLAERLLSWSLVPDDRDAAIGDLCEEFAARAARDGGPGARRWYWRQVRRSFFINLRRRTFEAGAPSGIPLRGGLLQDLRYSVRALV
jgi:hypothetical protein